MSEFDENVGKKVAKTKSNKPFKSGFKVNTVKSVIDHPILHIPAYEFFEDNSYVECRRCEVVEEYDDWLSKEVEKPFEEINT